MKKTSYFLICLIIALLAVIASMAIYEIRSTKIYSGTYTSSIIPLEVDEPINEVEFSMNIPKDMEPFFFSGVKIEINDSVEKPRLEVDSLIKKYINTRFYDKRLKVEVTMDEFDETREKMANIMIAGIRSSWPLRLVLPPSPLHRISSTFGGIKITGLETDKLSLFSNDHLEMTDCHIDSLIQSAGGDAKLTFKDSSIEYMRLSMEDNFIKINCCDSSSLIKKVDFIARENIKTNVFLNEANIDTFRWDPAHATQLTVRIKHPINIVK